jgi:lipid-binding SYLF domain-containing protein
MIAALRTPALMLTALLLALPAPRLLADSKEKIDSGSEVALSRLREHAPEAGPLLDRAVAVLVFPDVVEMGFGVGGEFGQGAMLLDGEPRTYHVIAGVSFGLDLSVEYKSEVLLFMTDDALRQFNASSRWQVGVDGAVKVARADALAGADTLDDDHDVIGFIFTNNGLVSNLSLDGAKISRIAK